MKNVLAMIFVVLSGTAAHAGCYGLRNGDMVCHNNPPVAGQSDAVHCTNAKSVTLDFDSSQSEVVGDQAKYTYTVNVFGKCPSRNCGSVDVQQVSASTDEANTTANAWSNIHAGYETKFLTLQSSVDSTKYFAVSYKTAGKQVTLLSLTINGLNFDAAAMNQLTCTLQ